MTQCWHQAAGTIELYFYGELAAAERDSVRRHLDECGECRRTLEELALIRAALEARPDVDAPPENDWSGFMARLERTIHQSPNDMIASGGSRRWRNRRTMIVALSMAALLVLATAGVLVAIRPRPGPQPGAVPMASAPSSSTEAAATIAARDEGLALTELSEQHFERSKLVVLGLATKDPQDSTGLDWDYERELASSLLSDTRLYRHAAEERGMESLADVMRDLELVLLQTSMSDAPDADSLAQLQRLIRRRDLITKMEVVKTSGLVP